ncbi:MAG: hypothetical protein OEY14_06615, partial [Myxococcales bacterium]|nr:hypothetical protein [Myxococcales bacterium]
SQGTVLLISGDRRVRLPAATERSMRGAGGVPGEGAWIVGDGGYLARVEADGLRVLSAGSTRSLLAAGALAGSLWFVGQWGTILRAEGRALVEIESPTDAALSGLIPYAEDELLAIGDAGTLLGITWQGVRTLESGTQATLHDGLAEDGFVIAVGAGGTILRGMPSAFVEERVPGVGELWSIAGSSVDALAVGEGGVLLRVHRVGVERVDCETERTLRGAWLEDGVGYAVGEGGIILRVDAEGACTVEHDGGPALHAIGRGPDGSLLALGEAGRALRRLPLPEGERAGASPSIWRSTDLGADEISLYGLHRDGRDVYVFGAGGLVLRHPRIDTSPGGGALGARESGT